MENNKIKKEKKKEKKKKERLMNRFGWGGEQKSKTSLQVE
jgi:hypothetical protein